MQYINTILHSFFYAQWLFVFSPLLNNLSKKMYTDPRTKISSSSLNLFQKKYY